jgi:hypothetical protein
MYFKDERQGIFRRARAEREGSDQEKQDSFS